MQHIILSNSSHKEDNIVVFDEYSKNNLNKLSLNLHYNYFGSSIIPFFGNKSNIDIHLHFNHAMGPGSCIFSSPGFEPVFAPIDYFLFYR